MYISLHGQTHRVPYSEEPFGEGNFYYKPDIDWCKWPEELRGIHVLNGRFTKENHLIVATDRKEVPLIEFDAEGNMLRSFGQGYFSKAHSVYLTPQNTILCADSSASLHVIQEIAMDGTLVRTFGNKGIPGDSGYDSNYLAVLKEKGQVPDDPAWKKRHDFNASLDSIRKIGKPFCRPCAMVMDSKGRYYAADGYGNAAVHRFAADGHYECSWGGPGKSAGKFRLVHDVYVDPLDRVWVADRENACVHIFDTEGKVLAYFADGLFRVGSICGDGSFVYIGELDGGVTIMDLNLNVISQFGSPGSPLHAHGITCDNKDNLYIFTNKSHPENNVLRLVKKMNLKGIR